MLLSLALALPLADGFTAFLGPDFGPGSVYYVDATGAALAAPELVDIDLLELDYAQRTRLHSLDPAKPRLRTDVPEGSRLVLPNGLGALYLYERSDPELGHCEGFLHISNDGVPTHLFELPGEAVFRMPISVSPAGDSFLVATRKDLGGDLLEVELNTGAVILRSSTLPPLDFNGDGLVLGTTLGAAATADGVYRFDRTDPTAQLQPVSFQAATPASFGKLQIKTTHPTWFSAELIASADGSRLMTVAGRGPSKAHVYTFGAQGPLRRLTKKPAPISPAGFAADYEDGPFWALSADGSRAAWKVVFPTSSELYTAAVLPGAPQQATHISQDAVFNPFLEEVGLLGFYQGPTLVAFLGDRSGQAFAMTRGDLYEIDFEAGGTSFAARNLTATSGDAVAPFTAYGMIQPNGAWWLPGPQRMMIADTYSVSALRGVNLVTGGVVWLCYPCVPPARVEHVANRIVVVEETEPTPDEYTLRILSFPDHLGVAGQELVSIPAEVTPIRMAVNATGEITFVDAEPEDIGNLMRIDVTTGVLDILQATPTVWGPTLAISSSGEALASQGDEDSPAQFLNWPSAAQGNPLFSAAAPGFILPGN